MSKSRKVCKRCEAPIPADRLRCAACRRPQDTVGNKRKAITGSYEKHPEVEDRIKLYTLRAQFGMPLFQEGE